jgi:hypothetical protein
MDSKSILVIAIIAIAAIMGYSYYNKPYCASQEGRDKVAAWIISNNYKAPFDVNPKLAPCVCGQLEFKHLDDSTGVPYCLNLKQELCVGKFSMPDDKCVDECPPPYRTEYIDGSGSYLQGECII